MFAKGGRNFSFSFSLSLSLSLSFFFYFYPGSGSQTPRHSPFSPPWDLLDHLAAVREKSLVESSLLSLRTEL